MRMSECALRVLLHSDAINTQTATEKAPNRLHASLRTAGSLENGGAGEGNRTLAFRLGKLTAQL